MLRFPTLAMLVAVALLGHPSAGRAQGDSGPAASRAPTIVVFGHNSAALTSQAQQAIDKTAAYVRDQGARKIEVRGSADQGESAVNNPTLSLRRAQAVAAELVRKGVAKALIDLSTASQPDPRRRVYVVVD